MARQGQRGERRAVLVHRQRPAGIAAVLLPDRGERGAEFQKGEVDRVVERKAADTAVELVGAAIELERRGTTGVGERHLAGNRAAAAECERAGRDCGAAGVVVCSRQSEERRCRL